MGKIYEHITDHQREWIARQPLFFVGSAPLDADGHVNVSPKGPIDTLKILDDLTVAYLDVVGSGAETIAHVRENGRIVVMLCAFDGPPRIVRLHGRGEVLLPGDGEYGAVLREAAFEDPAIPQAWRAIVRVQVTRIADSCGYGVPLMSLEEQRPHSRLWAQKKLRSGGPQAIESYVATRNAASIDGLPGVEGE
jgi:predicted pyridoxine 5'-phosphate oxidase superfamily flavin-nucleotide-binding protein